MLRILAGKATRILNLALDRATLRLYTERSPGTLLIRLWEHRKRSEHESTFASTWNRIPNSRVHNTSSYLWDSLGSVIPLTSTLVLSHYPQFCKMCQSYLSSTWAKLPAHCNLPALDALKGKYTQDLGKGGWLHGTRSVIQLVKKLAVFMKGKIHQSSGKSIIRPHSEPAWYSPHSQTQLY
jgi:hypothetical protein